MMHIANLGRIDWSAEATLFRFTDAHSWREVLCGELHALVQAVNAAHDDPWDFHIQVDGGGLFVGNEIRLLGCDATRPTADALAA